MLEPMSKQVIWRSLHNILPTRDRIHRLGLKELDGRQVVNTLCNRCDLRVPDSNVHMFTECGLVREAWCWVRRRVLDLLPDDMNDLSNQELVHLMYPKEQFEAEIIWVMGTYMNWVYEEGVIKGRVLSDEHARGYLRYMYYHSRSIKMPQIGYISGITMGQNIVFDDNG